MMMAWNETRSARKTQLFRVRGAHLNDEQLNGVRRHVLDGVLALEDAGLGSSPLPVAWLASCHDEAEASEKPSVGKGDDARALTSEGADPRTRAMWDEGARPDTRGIEGDCERGRE